MATAKERGAIADLHIYRPTRDPDRFVQRILEGPGALVQTSSPAGSASSNLMESHMSDQTTSASARKLAFIHTVAGLVSEFEGLAKQHLPDWKPFAILDESLLRNTIERGSLSDLTKRRLATYVWSAVDAGADAIVVTCSTLGPAVDAIAPLCPVPLFRIDEGMAKAAVEQGNRVGVLATYPQRWCRQWIC